MHLIPDEFPESLRGLARDGLLPKWSEWFGAGSTDALVFDRARQAAVVAEFPELQLSYFADCVPMPDGWASIAGGYVLLSDPYRPDAAEAAARGGGSSSGHRDIVTRPVEVAGALLDLIAHPRR